MNLGDIKFDQELDCRGLNCPLPVLKAKKTIDGMSSGDVLKMISTDPGSKNDISAWGKRTGNEVLGMEDEGGEFVYFIKKA